MKLLVVVPGAMFDAALPLLKALSKRVELYCLFDVFLHSKNLLELEPGDMNSTLVKALDVPKMQKYKDYIPLNNSYIVSLSSPKDLFKVLRGQIKILTLVRNLSPDHIYFYNVPYLAYLPTYLLSHVRKSIAVHDPIFHSGQKSVFYYSLLRKIVFSRCKNFFLFSESLVKPFIQKYKIPSEFVHLTSLGVYDQLNLYASNDLIKTEKDDNLKILFFGRIQPYKGVSYLLKAYKKIVEKGLNNKVELSILGKGHIESDIIDFLTPGLHINNSFISTNDLVHALQQADIIICPYTDATQSGVIMTSFALLKPVIATNVGGLGEMIEDGKTGILIKPCDVDAIYDSIMDFYKNRDLLDAMSSNIYQSYYLGAKSWNSIADRLINKIMK